MAPPVPTTHHFEPSHRPQDGPPERQEAPPKVAERLLDGEPARRISRLRALAREPLVQFLAIGAALFAFQGLSSRDAEEMGRRVVVTPQQIEQLRATFTTQWRRPPTRDELDGLVRSRAREEILYQEALRLGIDRDDTIVRRHLAQKMAFLNESAADAAPPGEEDLERFFAAHADRYHEPESVSFVQVYWSPERRGADGAEREARALLAELVSGTLAESGGSELGDPLLVEREHAKLSRADVEQLFGEEFARAVFALEPGAWRGPVRSSYGVHLVRVAEHLAGRLPELAQVRDRVEADWRHARREAADARFLEELERRYEVVVEAEPRAGRGGQPGASTWPAAGAEPPT